MSLRAANIDKIRGGSFDVLIIGGGINGAVTAAALASRGASVAMVDRGDFASFTSMQSSNLVWGGFKYMENYELLLVRNLCMSRNRLIKAYPENLKEIRFLAALDKHSPYPTWFAGLGATAYWAIGNAATKPPKIHSAKKLSSVEPAIKMAGVRGGLEYSDAYVVDNDSRFVFGFVRSALNVGAACANYVEVTGATKDGPGWDVQLHDTDTGEDFSAKAKVVINATGPFVDKVNEMFKIESKHKIVCSKGIHLIVPRLVDTERVLAFFDDTERLFYVIPMGPRSVIGTTDERVDDPETVVTDEDRDFLLEQINKRLDLPAPLTPADIISTRCGVRPLVVELDDTDSDDTDWTSLSRKHAVEIEETQNFISIFGGKITDCLNIGEELCDAVQELGIPLEADNNFWYGEPGKSSREEFFRQARLMKLDKLRKRAAFETLSKRLWRRYGMRAFAMLEAIRDDPSMAEEIIEGADYVRVELHFAAQTEMITKLDDFLRRRSKISLVLSRDVIKSANGIHEACELLFGEDAKQRYDEYFNDPALNAAAQINEESPEPVSS